MRQVRCRKGVAEYGGRVPPAPPRGARGSRPGEHTDVPAGHLLSSAVCAGRAALRGVPAAEQAGASALCPSGAAEHVDHCHKTGRVPGVPCLSCNAASGQFKDRPEAIRRAISYLEGNAWKPKLVAPGVYRLPS